MKYRFDVRVGPVTFRVGSAWRSPVAALDQLYAAYPRSDTIPDYTVRLEPDKPWRRVIRPSVAIRGDHILPDALPLPLAQGLLAAEMGMNLQLALGERRFLLLHAASVEKDGKGLILTGESGSGKSTLSALLGANGWRFMGDEFVLIEPETGAMMSFPRPVSLKNASITALEAVVPDARFGPRLIGTPKGDIRHLMPDPVAIAAMDRPAVPRLILFPRFGFAAAVRDVPPGETFVRLTQASTNYTTLDERGFEALTRLVTTVPAKAIDYPDTTTALQMVASL
jgi:HprK-related kinase A